MEITNLLPTAQEYISLRFRSQMSESEKQIKNVEIALRNSLYIVSVRDNDTLIGFGRIVGDGAITFIVSDIMVDKAYQGIGIGKKIMTDIDKYFDKHIDNDAYITLIADKPADKLYSKFSFKYAEPKSVGMIRIK